MAAAAGIVGLEVAADSMVAATAPGSMVVGKGPPMVEEAGSAEREEGLVAKEAVAKEAALVAARREAVATAVLTADLAAAVRAEVDWVVAEEAGRVESMAAVRAAAVRAAGATAPFQEDMAAETAADVAEVRAAGAREAGRAVEAWEVAMVAVALAEAREVVMVAGFATCRRRRMPPK